MRRDCLAVCELEQLRVLFAARAHAVDEHPVLESDNARRDVVVIFRRGGDGFADVRPFARPRSLEVLAEVFDRFYIVIREQEERAFRLDGGFGIDEGHVLAVAVRLLFIERNLDRDGACLRVRAGDIEPAPVDAKIVARTVEDILRHRAYAGGVEPAETDGFRFDGVLSAVVEAELLRRVYRGCNLVLFAVRGGGVEFKVRDGARKQRRVVEQKRRREAGGQPDAGAFEYICCRHSAHVERGLLHRGRIAQTRYGRAHKAVRCAVNLDDAAERVVRAGPVADVRIGQNVRKRPEGKVRVDRYKRYGRRTKSHISLSCFIIFIYGNIIADRAWTDNILNHKSCADY